MRPPSLEAAGHKLIAEKLSEVIQLAPNEELYRIGVDDPTWDVP